MIGHQRISRSVGLVEAVACEFRYKIKDIASFFRVNATLNGAVTEAAPLLVHLFLDLLAHGAPQDVCFPKAVAGHDLRDLHHLLLVDDHAVGFA